MAKISELPVVHAITGTESVPIVQGDSMMQAPLMSLLAAPQAADVIQIGTRSLSELLTALPAELASEIANSVGITWPDPAQGAAAVAVGQIFYAIAPDGSTSSLDGNRDVSGERRSYKKVGAATWTDLGDRATQLNRSMIAPVLDILTGLVAIQGDDVQGAVDHAVAIGAKGIILPAGMTATISVSVNLPNAITKAIIDGLLLRSGNFPVFTRTGGVARDGSGALQPSRNITAPIAAGARTVSVVAPEMAVGDWYFVVSTDTLPGTTDKLGYMRYIRSFTGTTATLDTAIPRAMPNSSRRMRKIALAAPITITGTGTIDATDPSIMTASVLWFTFCRDVVVTGVRIRGGVGRGVQLSHVIGGNIDTRIEDFTDINNNAYGVDVQGACRNIVVNGQIARCRHACTTNVGPDLASFSFYGEPENIKFAPLTSNCSDKALDTHRAGWGVTMILNDIGSGGGAQVRCDAVYVEGVASGCFSGAGLQVREHIVVPPTIGPLKLSYVSNAPFVQLSSPAIFTVVPDLIGAGTRYSIDPGVVATWPAATTNVPPA